MIEYRDQDGLPTGREQPCDDATVDHDMMYIPTTRPPQTSDLFCTVRFMRPQAKARPTNMKFPDNKNCINFPAT